MADTMQGLRRTCLCGEVTLEMGEVVVGGFTQRVRDKGSLIFIDLRDKSGIVQLVFDENTEKSVFEKAESVRSEYVLLAKGTVRARESVNTEIKTGGIEIVVTELRILSKAQTPPFEIVSNTKTNEELRLKYRYLDLRREPLQKNLMMRHEIAKAAREYFYANGFTEIETPMMIKSTPEGARDYIVPSRIHNGKFYALPQSPQMYKQLLMIAGMDRYIQLARCFRDEDLRADRQPEFTQIDLEMSFVDVDDILECLEGFVKHLYKTVLNVDIPTPLPRLTYDEAMTRYGSDKPDTRFGMELYDLTDIVKDCGFSVFSGAAAGGGTVRGITAKSSVKALTRKEIDKLTEFVRGIGAKGLAWIRLTPEGTTSSFAKFMTEDEMQAILTKAGAETGDVVLIVADTMVSHVLSALGALRNEVAKKLDIIPQDTYNLLWITEFPFFEWDEETETFVAMHHPFTAPMDECLYYLETDKANVRAKAYDLVLNGVELSSGSIRITDPTLQNRIFSLLGLSEEEAKAKFGYLLDAFRFGAPPHGGFGIGLDRLIMQMLRCETLRDVVAYPKVQNASEPMTECPAQVDEIQLQELGITLQKAGE